MLGVALLGAGCSQSQESTTPTDVKTGQDGTVLPPEVAVQGSWFLNFETPNGWVMVPHYDEGFAEIPRIDDVTTEMSDVVLQSTDKIVVLTGEASLPQGSYITDGYSYIRVFRMDKRSIVPAEAEDIGNNFFKLEKGVNLTYYYKGSGATYKFVVYQDEQEQSVVEDVIKSAKEVTEFSGQE